MKILISLLFIMLTSTYAFASPYGDADVLFGCFFNNQKVPKEVAVLRSGDTVTYMFGKQDPTGEGGVIPEITVEKNISELTREWHNSRAEGFTLSELHIPNGEYTYNIGYTNKDGKSTGDIGVYKNGEMISSLTCTDVWESNLENQALMQGIPDADGNPGTAPDTLQQNGAQPPQQTPVKVQFQDIPHDLRTSVSAKHEVTRHIYVYSLVDSVTITELSIDRGSCYKWDIKPATLAYGKRLDFYLPISSQVAYANAGWNWAELENRFSKCMWSGVEVKTNMGNYTFNFN